MSPRTWIESTNIPKCVNLNRKPSGGHSSGVIVDKNSRNLTADKWKYLIPLCFRFRLKLLFIKRVRVRMCEFERETRNSWYTVVDMSSWNSWEMKVSYSDCDWSFFMSEDSKSEYVNMWIWTGNSVHMSLLIWTLETAEGQK